MKSCGNQRAMARFSVLVNVLSSFLLLFTIIPDGTTVRAASEPSSDIVILRKVQPTGATGTEPVDLFASEAGAIFNNTDDSHTLAPLSVSQNATKSGPVLPPIPTKTVKIVKPEKKSPVIITENVSIEAAPTKDNEIKTSGGKVALRIPKGATANAVKIDLVKRQPTAMPGKRMVSLFEMNAREAASGRVVTQFNKDLEITVKHTPQELRGLNLDTLRLFYLDPKTRQWTPVTTGRFDKQSLTHVATINHFSEYAELADPLIDEPGRVMNTQVNLNSGTAAFSYPIELPPGPGGFQPRLSLKYNSGIVDEMKDKRSSGSWVGIGWSLNPGRISYNPNNGDYFLELNGISYKIVPNAAGGTSFKTEPDIYFKISRSGNTWEVRDTEGNYYRFGGTNDATQFVGTVYYRWDLSLMQDTNGNQATIEYVQDTLTDTDHSVRAAYPSYIRYSDNMTTVHFTSSWYTTRDSGHARRDNPPGSVYNPELKVYECRQLDSIEISENATLLRKYLFTYSTTDYTQSTDYGSIYYAGKHTLSTITRVGADGTSQLPAMTFAYQDLQIYRYDPTQNSYYGDPGNPASINRPYLTAINSGYGGSLSFQYTQTPGNTSTGIWTREVVTQKTSNSGSGPAVTVIYTYFDGPNYDTDFSWSAEYRGFGEVHETDAQGHISKHWFYTIGEADGKPVDKLKGLEYKTEQYNSGSATPVRSVVNDWSWKLTTEHSAGVYAAQFSQVPASPALASPEGVAISHDNHIFVADTGNNRCVEFDSSGVFYNRFDLLYPGAQSLCAPSGIAISGDNSIYIADSGNRYLVKFDAHGAYVGKVACAANAVAISPQQYIYVLDTASNNIMVYSAALNLMQTISTAATNPALTAPTGIAASPDGYLYVVCARSAVAKYTASGSYISSFPAAGHAIAITKDRYLHVVDPANSRVSEYSDNGTCVSQYAATTQGSPALNWPKGIAISADNYIYVADTGNSRIVKYELSNSTWAILLNQVDVTMGNKTARQRYSYDGHGNIVTMFEDGDASNTSDNATVWRSFFPNLEKNILRKPARERLYVGTVAADIGDNLTRETLYYYDGNGDWAAQPSKGNATRMEQKRNSSQAVAEIFTYDTYGNQLTRRDPNGIDTTLTYESTHRYPQTKIIAGLSENYTWDMGTRNVLGATDINGQSTTFAYDTFKRRIKAIRPGDTPASPSIQYQYNNWGTLNQQHAKTIVKISDSASIWYSRYFDGLGRVIQTQAQGETGRTIISATTTFNNRGLVDKQYVSQDLDAAQVNGYKAPETNWKYSTAQYDSLERPTVETKADGTSISHDYSTAWEELVTNERGNKKRYYFDAYRRTSAVVEYNSSQQVYATTGYNYDVPGNLIQVTDAKSNVTGMTYDWLGRKTAMSDPDMGDWSYTYDDNGNLLTQTDAKGQVITLSYDELNRPTGKTYPAESGMTNVTYSYDSVAGGNFGKGRRTGMADAAGSTTYKYDARGRLVEENRSITGAGVYTTRFAYDGADRLTTVTYPTGENVTTSYNGRGLPNTLTSSLAPANLVTGTVYSQLGSPIEIDFGNNLKTTYGYWGVGNQNDTSGGYYGRLWRIRTLRQSGDGTALQDIKHTWDAGGNLTQREDTLAAQTEGFTYDFLDRLLTASGPYAESYAYDEIGNITSKNQASYTYGTKPHAVTSAGLKAYSYDDNGNMVTRGSDNITWDMENRPISISYGPGGLSRAPGSANTFTTAVSPFVTPAPPDMAGYPAVRAGAVAGGKGIKPDGEGDVKLLGVNDSGTIDASANYVLFHRFQCTQSGTVKSIRVYSRLSGSVKAALYSDSGGSPYHKFSDNTTAVSGGQWNTITIADTSVTVGTYYWIGFITNTTGAARFLAAGSGTRRYKAETYSAYSFPAIYAGTFTADNYGAAVAA